MGTIRKRKTAEKRDENGKIIRFGSLVHEFVASRIHATIPLHSSKTGMETSFALELGIGQKSFFRVIHEYPEPSGTRKKRISGFEILKIQ